MFIGDYVTVCQDRNVVIIVINFSNWGRHIVARTLDVGGNCESFFWKMKENNKRISGTIPVPFSSMISLRCQLTNPSFVMQCIFQAISDKRDNAEVRR